MSKKYNTTTWKHLRTSKLSTNSICECCNKLFATEVHHFIPFLKGRDDVEQSCLFEDYRNLVSLCHECHMNVHKLMRCDSEILDYMIHDVDELDECHVIFLRNNNYIDVLDKVLKGTYEYKNTKLFN